MKARKGFTVIELIAVIAIIGILATIGYPFVAKAIMRAKAQKVVASLKDIQKAIADTLGEAGGYYQSTGTASSLKVASPQPLPTPIPGQTCGYNASNTPNNITIEYLNGGSPAVDKTCHGQRIEKTLHDKLVALGIKWSTTTSDFRLPTYPLAHISFPFEVNGVRTIRIWGIQGDLAYNVFEELNGRKTFSRYDGWTPSTPVAIAKIKIGGQNGGGKYGAGTEVPCLSMLDQLNTPEKSFDCIVSGQNLSPNDRSQYFYVAGEENEERNAPKVVLYYTYAFGYSNNDNTATNENTGSSNTLSQQ